MGVSIFDEILPFRNCNIIDDNPVDQPIFIASAQDRAARVDLVIFASTDVIDHNVQLSLQVGGTVAIIGTVVVPAGAGYVGVPSVEAIAHLPLAAQGGVLVMAGDFLYAQTLEAVTATKQLTMVMLGGYLA